MEKLVPESTSKSGIVLIFRDYWFDLLLLAIFALTLIFLVVNVNGDINVHTYYLVEYLEHGYFPIPPGYYALIYLLDIVFYYKYPFILSSILLLTFFHWWKYRILLSWTVKAIGKKGFTPLISIFTMIMAPLVIPGVNDCCWYLGKFTGHLWHNSTLIAAIPFSLILYQKTLEWWEKPSARGGWVLFALGAIILLIKPSFLFCYLPLFPLFTFFFLGFWSRAFLSAAAISMVLLGLIGWEKHLIYAWDPLILEQYDPLMRPSILVTPFKVWFHFSRSPLWDFLSSFSLSIVFFSFWGKHAIRCRSLLFSSGLVLLGLLVYFLFSESGFREFHGNFYWQIPIVLTIHSAQMVLFILRILEEKGYRFDFKTGVFFCIFCLQALFGIAYWLRIFFEESLI